MPLIDWLSVFAIVISLVSLVIVICDHQERCKVILKKGNCEQLVSDDDGFLHYGLVPGVEVYVINKGRPTFYIDQIRLNSSHLPGNYIVLEPKRKKINPDGSITVEWHRSVKSSLSYHELAHALNLDSSKSKKIKLWVEVETESGRHFLSKKQYLRVEQLL